MLTIITGGAMSHKDEMLREKIKSACMNGKQAFVFVPDQFSYEYDKMLYEIFGVKMFNKIEVVGLNRFCENLRKKYGSEKGVTADDNTRIITMYQAIRNFRHTNKAAYYTKNLEKPSFANTMLDMTSQLFRNGISPVTLKSLSEKTNGTLQNKLYDIGNIYENYEKCLDEKGLCDGLSVVSEACEIIKNNDVLSDCEIFFDRYDSFSRDEFRLIEAMLCKCDNMAVAITLSNENNSKSSLSPFATTLKTCADLERIARSVGVEIKREKSAQYYYNKPALTHVNTNIFCLENHPAQNHDGVRVAVVQDMYDEVEYVCARIKRLVRENHLKYSDIAIISRQLSEYIPILEGAFEKYEIPAFIDAKNGVLKSTLAIYIMSVLDCLKGKTFSTEKILRMIKSPLSPFKDFEVCAIEEYCYLWGVNGNMWKSPFTASDSERDNLVTVNRIRERIITPLCEFKDAEGEMTATKLVGMFIKILNDYQVTSCVNSVVKTSLSVDGEKSYITDKSTEIELVREFGQIWSMFVSSLRSVNENIGEEKLSLKEFSDMLTLLFSQMSISNPPQRLNTVTVASAEHSRLSAVKSVFVLGVNADRLPCKVSKGGIFTDKEIRTLEELGFELASDAIDAVKTERLVAYLALTQGSDELTVCCPKADKKGKSLVPSVIVRDLIKMFGNGVVEDVSKLKADFFCLTEKSAYSKFSECMNDNTTEAVTLKTALEKLPKTSYKVKSLYENSRKRKFSLSEEVSEKLFFRNSGEEKVINLSPSSIEKYNKCPFDYFCNYGLNLRTPVKNEINGINRGNIFHYVLENLLSVKEDGKTTYNTDFEKMTEAEIREKVTVLANEYKNNNMGGDFGKNYRFEKIFSRIIENTVSVVLNIQLELLNSSFKPEAFEYSITDADGKSMLRIKGDDFVVNVRGIIDRIDTFTNKDGKSYVKIVDYKTGRVSNLLKKVFHGVSLQLIIYLLALLEGDSDYNREDTAAGGIVYTPAIYIDSSSAVSEDKKAPSDVDGEAKLEIKAGFARDYVNKKLHRLGFVLDDEEVLFALSHTEKSTFIPKDSHGKLNSEAIRAIGKHTSEQVKKVGERLKTGDISAIPLVDATGTQIKKPCSYCEFFDICGVKNAKPERLMTNDDEDKLLSILDDYMRKEVK